MNREAFSAITVLTLLLISTLTLAFNIQTVKSGWTGTVYIRADGSIDPPDAPIITYDNVTYTLTDNITSSGDGIVVERDSIIIDGAGYTIQGTGSGTGIVLSYRTNVTVRNTQIKSFFYGVWLYSSSNNIISGNNITNNLFGIYLVQRSFNVTIAENIIHDHLNCAVGVFDSSLVKITQNNMTSNGPIILSANSSNISVIKNIMENTGLSLLGYTHNNLIIENIFTNRGLSAVYTYNNTVKDNIVNGKPLIYLEGASNLTITDTGNELGQLIIVNCNNVLIENISISEVSIGIQFYNVTNSRIRNSSISSNVYFAHGIELCASFNNTIEGNDVFTQYIGIGLWDSNDNKITKNSITTQGDGIILVDSYNNNILDNDAIANGQNGVGLSHSFNNTIRGNNIIANGNHGVWVYFKSDNNQIIENNLIANMRSGVCIIDAKDNIICHNNFINNTIQVRTWKNWYETINVWDNGYPSGGNYWSDYTGVDEKRGPYQNETGSDGIGDAPYVIDANNKDNYPLMNPWGSGTPIASFTWTPSVPEVGEVVTFDASASMPVGGEVVSYEWDFGDGNRATGEVATHAYGSAGTFKVTLNVTDSEGLWDIEQKQIEVKAPPPPLTVSISPSSASILLGESVTFTSTTSGGCPPYTYQWYLNGNPVSGATSDTWTFTPTAIGVYYVYVRVIDVKNDAAQSETAYISVTSAPVVAPIAAFTWSPRSPLEGETVVFDASASKPNSGEIVRFVWSFGDGEFGEGQLVTHTYSRSGLYKVTLTVFSSEGLSDDVSDYIFVRPKCFILTAVLGTDAKGDLNYLRLFRDKILRTNPVGEAFVAFYYEASPPIAEQLSRNQLLRVLTAILFVQPLIVTVKILLSPYSIALYAALALLFLYAAKKRKLKALLTFIQVSAITATAISLTALTLGLIAKTIPQASIIASIMLPTIIPTAIITATIKTFKKQRKKPTISSANL